MRLLPASFRARLAILFGGLTLLIAVPVYWYVDQVFAAQLVAARGNALHDLAGAVSTIVSENLKERQREIELLAQTPLYRRNSFDDPDLKASIERRQRSYPHYSWLGFADSDGIVRVANKGLLVGESVKKRPWFFKGLEGPFVGDLHEAVLLARLLPPPPGNGPLRFIDFAVPVYDEKQNLRGVLGAHAEWSWARDVIGVMTPADTRANGLDIFIVNSENRVVYPDEARGATSIPAAITASASATQPYVQDDWGSATRYLNASAAVHELYPSRPLGWKIVVRQPVDVALAALYSLQKALLILGVAMLAVLLALTFWMAARISRPLEKLAREAKLIEQGEGAGKARLEISTGIGELRHLIDAFRGMTATLATQRDALTESNVQLEQKVSARTAELAQLNEEFRQQARRDALTGLDNRLAVNERLHEEFVRMKRSGRAYAVMLMDIDHFKKVNDTHGHAVGDETLQHVAQILKASLRESDFVARFGGEEFFALLPETDLENAKQVADKIRARIETANLPVVKKATISVGLAMASTEHNDEDDAVRDADHWLYQAKATGRNRVAFGTVDTKHSGESGTK